MLDLFRNVQPDDDDDVTEGRMHIFSVVGAIDESVSWNIRSVELLHASNTEKYRLHIIDFSKKQEKKPNTFREVMRLNKQEKWYLLLGCLTSLLIGGLQVGAAIINAEIYDVSFVPPVLLPNHSNLGTSIPYLLLLQIFRENDTQVRTKRTVAVCSAFGGMAAIRLVCYTLNVSSTFCLIPCLNVCVDRLKKTRIRLVKRLSVFAQRFFRVLHSGWPEPA